MKYVLITGAYGGMGQATTKELVQNGYTVIALDKKIKENQTGVIPIEVDITDENSVLAAFNKVSEITNELYAIVHFAGVYMLDSLIEMPSEEFDKIFKINVYGAFLVNKIFTPMLNKDSRILMTTSELAPLDPLPFTGIYAITKSTLDKYAYSLKMEMQLKGVYISVLRAGAVSTAMLGVSTSALDRFCEKTENYKVNADRFRQIVNGVEAKNISPNKIAKKVCKILSKSKPKFAYKINRNKLLLLLNILPKKFQFWIIKKILKDN